MLYGCLHNLLQQKSTIYNNQWHPQLFLLKNIQDGHLLLYQAYNYFNLLLKLYLQHQQNIQFSH